MKIKTFIVSSIGQLIAFDEKGEQIVEVSFDLANYAEWCKTKGFDATNAVGEFFPARNKVQIVATTDSFNYQPIS